MLQTATQEACKCLANSSAVSATQKAENSRRLYWSTAVWRLSYTAVLWSFSAAAECVVGLWQNWQRCMCVEDTGNVVTADSITDVTMKTIGRRDVDLLSAMTLFHVILNATWTRRAALRRPLLARFTLSVFVQCLVSWSHLNKATVL